MSRRANSPGPHHHDGTGPGEQRTGGGAAVEAHVVIERHRHRLDARIEVARGEVVGVMGPSGAGKSTLLAALSGSLRLSGGTVRIGEETSTRRHHVPTARRGTVLLGQDPRLFPHLSARDNVAFGPRARGIAKDRARHEADEWLRRVGLPDSGDHRPRELSGGQQQRVAVARALAAAPRLLLLDEPLTSLDPVTAGEIRAMLREQLATAHVTTLLVTHDAVDAASLATRVVVIEDGAVTQQGEVRDVFAAPATPFVAAAAGVNRVPGEVRGGLWRADGAMSEMTLAADARIADGTRYAAVFRPSAVRLERAAQEPWTGAPRLARDGGPVAGEWMGRVARLDQTPAGARVHTTAPDVAADVAVDAIAAAGLTAGDPVRLRIAAADVTLQPIGPAAAPTRTLSTMNQDAEDRP
jgi:molybdate transport system ATP-binding protein